MKWKDKIISECVRLHDIGQIDSKIVDKLLDGECGIHLAIFVEPYITLVFSGEKTLESRFSINQIAPFGKIFNGDIVFIKRSGGNIEGYFIADNVIFISNLKKDKHTELEEKYGKRICTQADPNFWVDRANSRFLTIVEIKYPQQLGNLHLSKNDRLAWSVLRQRVLNDLFYN